MSGENRSLRIRQREPLTDAQLLMIISIGIFVARRNAHTRRRLSEATADL